MIYHPTHFLTAKFLKNSFFEKSLVGTIIEIWLCFSVKRTGEQFRFWRRFAWRNAICPKLKICQILSGLQHRHMSRFHLLDQMHGLLLACSLPEPSVSSPKSCSAGCSVHFQVHRHLNSSNILPCTAPFYSFLHFSTQQIDVRFSCVCTVTDHEFRHSIIKVVMDPQGDSRVNPQTTLTMLWRNSLSITGQTNEKLTSICFSL